MSGSSRPGSLAALQQEIVNCERCPRLRAHSARIAHVKRRAYLDLVYWGRPVPSFGDPRGRLLIVGLAPGAHGANRTGRVFTGDASGDFLYGLLHKVGFASQPQSMARDDGLTLSGCYISSAVRCAPPQNKPNAQEIAACRSYLAAEIRLLPRLRAVLALGGLAHNAYLDLLRSQGASFLKKDFPFAHGSLYQLPHGPALLCSYHPSRQNTQTGRLTKDMMLQILRVAKDIASDSVCAASSS